mgnify:CR=1 FL=1
MAQEEKFHQSFRQRWLPTYDDADNALENLEKTTDNKINCDYRDVHTVWHMAKKYTRTVIVGGALLGVGFQGFGNNTLYSEGERVGVINKFSKGGFPWKTYNGQLSLEGRTSTGDYTGAGVWDFSIDMFNDSDLRSLPSDITKYMKDGARVNVKYNQMISTWPWRAGTTYLVKSIEPTEKK